MELIQVELKKTRYMAYLFDGKEDCIFEGAIGMELSVRPVDPGIDETDESKFCEPCWIF